MSKNNVEEISKRVFNQSGRYALRKLSVGVASVLIGTTMYVGLAHADTVATSNEPAPIAQAVAPTMAQSSNNDTVTSLASDSGGSVQASTSSSINRKVTSNTNTQQFSSTNTNQLSVNGTNRQNLNYLQASLVQDNNNTDWTRDGYYQARASNVDFSLTDTYDRSGNGFGAEIPTEISLGFSENYHFGIKAHFDLNTSDLVVNNKVYLGSIVLSNSLNDSSHNLKIAEGGDGTQLGALMYQGELLGQIYERAVDSSLTDFYLVVTENNQFVIPKLTVTNWVDQDISAYNWGSKSSVYKGVPANFVENLIMPGGKAYHFNMYYSYFDLNYLSLHTLGVVGTHSFNLFDYASPTFSVDGGHYGQSLTPADFDVLNNKNGEGLVLPNIGYQAAYTYRPSIVGAFPAWISVSCSLYVKGADGKLTNDFVVVYNPSMNYVNVGNGYTLAELKLKSQPGTAIYSLQNDGTYLCYVNLSFQQLVMSKGAARNSLLQNSKIIAMQGDKALQNTLDLYFGKAFNGRPFCYQFATYAATTSSYDRLNVSNIQALNVKNGRPLVSFNTWNSVPDISQVAGKAAIRVHYINGYNGQQIGNSQTFNDDQGKTLSYQAQNSLGAGYSFRRSGSHALLDGQSLPSSYTLLDGSQKSSITYPRENTVSDVYYVIDPDPQQLVIKYYDLSGNLVSSKQVAGYTDQRVSLSYLTSAGYVLATQSQPSSYQFGTDHNELDLVVAPRVTMAIDSRTITRTIKITKPDGSVQTVLQRAQFTRPQYTDTLTHVVSYGSWTTPSQFFVEYDPDIVDGYTAESVSAIKVLPTDIDSVVSVEYVKNPTVSAPKYVDALGHEYAALPTGYHAVTGQNQNQAGILIAKDVAPVIPQSTEYVTRTVVITLPNNRTRTIRQRVRKGTCFGRFAVPKLRGYKVVVTGDSQELGMTAAERDVAMSVRFVKM